MKELKCSDLGMKCDFVAKSFFKMFAKGKMKSHVKKVHEKEMAAMKDDQKAAMDEKMDALLSK